MGFRRSKQKALEGRKWRQFLAENRDLLITTGVPCSIYESRELFDDLLMHGFLDHHPDPTRFAVVDLNSEQKSALAELIARFLRSGFDDPGLALFSPEIEREIRDRAAETEGTGGANALSFPSDLRHADNALRARHQSAKSHRRSRRENCNFKHFAVRVPQQKTI